MRDRRYHVHFTAEERVIYQRKDPLQMLRMLLEMGFRPDLSLSVSRTHLFICCAHGVRYPISFCELVFSCGPPPKHCRTRCIIHDALQREPQHHKETCQTGPYDRCSSALKTRHAAPMVLSSLNSAGSYTSTN